MLPFLLAGGVALLGKAVYDAVTKDSSSTSSTSSSSSSSSSGSVSQAELAKARQKAKAEQKKARTDELIASTSREVQSLLDTHAHLVGGEARLTPPPLIQGALSSWPTGTAELLTLKLHLLRKTAAIPNTASGLDLLTPLTRDLAYTDAHALEELSIRRMITKRDALKNIVDSL